MGNRIVLGHPYEGSFYWIMTAEDWRKTSIKSPYTGGHQYYKALYGLNPDKYIDETASLCILYDHIYLAPADCPLPDWKKHTEDESYYNKELGILSDWAWYRELNDIDRSLSIILDDISVNQFLQNFPEYSRKQVIRGVLVQLSIANRFDADIMGSDEYLKLCDRIRIIIGSERSSNKVSIRNQLLQSLRAVFNISSLRFSLESISDFMSLRQSRPLKRYAAAFRQCVEELSTGTFSEQALYKEMMEAINTSEIANQISGGLNVSATLCSAVSLLPIIGTIVGSVGLAAEAGSRAASKSEEKRKWWLLAPEIASTLTKHRIEEKYKELERTR